MFVSFLLSVVTIWVPCKHLRWSDTYIYVLKYDFHEGNIYVECKLTRTQMIPAPFWAIKQRVVVISYRRFGTTYWSHRP